MLLNTDDEKRVSVMQKSVAPRTRSCPRIAAVVVATIMLGSAPESRSAPGLIAGAAPDLTSEVAASKEGNAQDELNFWNAIRDSHYASDYEAYLRVYPKGRFAALAKARIEQLKAPQVLREFPTHPPPPSLSWPSPTAGIQLSVPPPPASRPKPRAPSQAATRVRIFDEVDRVLASLPKAPMAFNTPAPMNIDDAAVKVELRVGPRLSPAELVKSITAPGTVEVHQVQISNRMKAELTGEPDGLTITPLTPALQVVGSGAATVWMWSVKPLKAGSYPIHVELEDEIKIDGELTPFLIDVFDGTIAVTITGTQRVEHIVRDNWQWLWTALLVPVGGWWWKRKAKKDDIDVGSAQQNRRVD